jgi:hypothetical protein
MKRFQTIGTLLVLTGLLVGCSKNLTGPDETITSQGTAQVVMKGEPRRTVINAFGSPSILLLTGHVENIGEAAGYSARVKYTQGCVYGSCGTSPLIVQPGESASFSMYIDLNSSPRGVRTYNITWCDSP